MKKIWKPLLLIFVVGIMAADLFFDFRSDRAVGTAQAEQEATNDPSVADLPVGTQMGDLAPDFTGVTSMVMKSASRTCGGKPFW